MTTDPILRPCCPGEHYGETIYCYSRKDADFVRNEHRWADVVLLKPKSASRRAAELLQSLEAEHLDALDDRFGADRQPIRSEAN